MLVTKECIVIILFLHMVLVSFFNSFTISIISLLVSLPITINTNYEINILSIISTYNELVRLRNKVKDQWSQIDVQLKRRCDLIPNLVETVKGYAKHEKGTLEAVIKARNTFLTAKSPEDEMKASKEVTTALNKLFALAEAYPDLKANENFTSLQNTLSETEDKISYARQFYNDNVMNYKNKIEMFVNLKNIIAFFLTIIYKLSQNMNITYHH